MKACGSAALLLLLLVAYSPTSEAQAAQGLLQRADAAYSSGNRELAKSLYRAVLASDPNNSRAAYQLARLSPSAEAVALLRRYVKLQPEDPWGYMALAVRSRPPQSAGRIGRLRGPGQDLARCRTHRRAGEELRTMGVAAAKERGSLVRARAGAAAGKTLRRSRRCACNIARAQGERPHPGVARQRFGGNRVFAAALFRPQRRLRPGPDHPAGPRRRMAVHAALAPGPARGTERGEGPLQLGDGRCRGAHREVAAAQYPQAGRLCRRRAAEPGPARPESGEPSVGGIAPSLDQPRGGACRGIAVEAGSADRHARLGRAAGRAGRDQGRPRSASEWAISRARARTGRRARRGHRRQSSYRLPARPGLSVAAGARDWSVLQRAGLRASDRRRIFCAATRSGGRAGDLPRVRGPVAAHLRARCGRRPAARGKTGRGRR